MKFTAEQIAGILDGQVIGNPNAEVYKLSKIEEGTEGSLTFLSNPKYQNYIYTTQATIAIVNDTSHVISLEYFQTLLASMQVLEGTK